MSAKNFIIWILILTAGWALVYGHFDKYFDGADLERKKAASLEKALHKEARYAAKLESRFSEFKDSLVAAGVKIDKNTSWVDGKRSIASVISDPSYKNQNLLSSGKISFDYAKKVFLSGNYRRTAELFEEFSQTHPDSPYLPEAQYFLGESYYLIGNKEGALRAINTLITHFPETTSSCYGMLRLGKILEKQERLEDAQEIYSLAKPLFPKTKCESLASSYLKSLAL